MLAAQPLDLVDEVLRWGWNTTAFQLLEPGHRYLRAAGATIAYRETRTHWVAAGAPLGPEEALAPAAQAFIAAARAAGRRACFAPVEPRFLACTGLRKVAIGAQPVWDAEHWPATLAATPALRAQVRRAARKGVRARLLSADELAAPALRDHLRQLTAAWLAGHALPPLDFLVHVELFAHAALRRVFVAEIDGAPIAVAALVPVPARRGWLLEDLLRAPGAPNGTSELLFDHVLRALGDGERDAWVTLGLTPLAGTVSPALRLAGRALAPLYDFEGLAAFRRRLRPHAWTPLYLAYPERWGAPAAMLATLRALAGGSLRRLAVPGLRAMMR